VRVDAYGLRVDRDPSLVPDLVRRIPPGIAVFDADGTLWTDDAADDFTLWMISTSRIPGDSWDTYLRIYRSDPCEGCRFLLTLYKGLDIASVRSSVDEWWRDHANRRWIPEVVESLHLASGTHPVWVVSGTPTDILVPLLAMLPVDEVLGMDFELSSGRITGKHSGVSCTGEGKAEKILSLAAGRPISFCAGNGSLDGPMMEIASRAWSVYPNPDFEAYSRARGWPVLPRPPGFVEERKFLE